MFVGDVCFQLGVVAPVPGSGMNRVLSMLNGLYRIAPVFATPDEIAVLAECIWRFDSSSFISVPDSF